LRTGTRLPSSRALAQALGVSRGVISDAYDQLVSEGYLEVRARAAPRVAAVMGTTPAPPELPPSNWQHDFVATTPDVSLFPRRAWIRAVDRSLRVAPDNAFDYGDHRGRPELRQALSGYLARVRGVRIDPGRIVVTQGFTQALDLLSRVLAAQGRTTIAVETPSLPDGWETVRESRLRVVGCPVDGQGIRVDPLASLGANAVIVTPAHQFPTGAVLAPARRSALVAWAESADALIIEDDYDAEFRYDRAAIGAVQGLDPERVAHIGTASKTLAPGCRLGWASLPAHLVDEVKERKAAADSGSPAIDQLAFADLLVSGEYERHVARVRHVYRRRRDRLVTALARAMPALPVRGAAAGMHLLVPLPAGTDDTGIVRAAEERGIRVRALSPLHVDPRPERGLLFGYGRLVEERVDQAVDELVSVVRGFAAVG
jgi:GntR family transcriptional regulator/MocR family aminotransferase